MFVVLPLREHEEASTVFPGKLANLFIVSEVALEEGDGPARVAVERALLTTIASAGIEDGAGRASTTGGSDGR